MLEDLAEKMGEIEIKQGMNTLDNDLWNGFNNVECKGTLQKIYIPDRQENTFCQYGIDLKMHH